MFNNFSSSTMGEESEKPYIQKQSPEIASEAEGAVIPTKLYTRYHLRWDIDRDSVEGQALLESFKGIPEYNTNYSEQDISLFAWYKDYLCRGDILGATAEQIIARNRYFDETIASMTEDSRQSEVFRIVRLRTELEGTKDKESMQFYGEFLHHYFDMINRGNPT